MKKSGDILGALVCGLVGLAITFLCIGYLIRDSYETDTTKAFPPNGVVDKYETEDGYYLRLVVEVSPDDYIRYDIGDEYGRTE